MRIGIPLARRLVTERNMSLSLTSHRNPAGCTGRAQFHEHHPGQTIAGDPVSRHAQHIHAVHREHAAFETGSARTAAAMGLRNSLEDRQVNPGWVIAANITAA